MTGGIYDPQSGMTSMQKIKALEVPMVYTPSTTNEKGKPTYFMLAPSGFPQLPMEGRNHKDRVKRVAKTLKKMGFAKVQTYLKGRELDRQRAVSIGVFSEQTKTVFVSVFDRPYDISNENLMNTDVKHYLTVRVVDETATRPIAIYSTHPIPDVVQHYCNNSPEVLFEGLCSF